MSHSARSSHAALQSVLVTLVAALAVALILAPRAQAAFGDAYGLQGVNGAGVQDAPAFPGTAAFWAGTCDTATAPTGPIPGGLGSRPPTVWAPDPANLSSANTASIAVPAPDAPDHCIAWGRVDARSNDAGGTDNVWLEAPDWRLAPVTRAGAHPDGTATMWFRPEPGSGTGIPAGTADNISVDLPAGFVGDPTAVPKCTAEQFADSPVECPPETQVGVIRLYLNAAAPFGGANYGWANEEGLPVYNLEPRHGNVAELGFPNASAENAVTVRIVAKARTNGDFGVTTFVAQIPAALPLLGQSITLWGTPWSNAHDGWRTRAGGRCIPSCGLGEIPPGGLPAGDRVGYDSSWGPIRPFLSNPTECTGAELSTRLVTDSYENPGAFTTEGDPDLTLPTNWESYDSPADAVTACDKPPFAPSATFRPTATTPDSPSGLSVDIAIPQNDDPPAGVATDPDDATGAPGHWRSDAGLATAQLDRAVVSLPDGVAVNPSGATGLQGCSDEQIGVTNAATNPMLFDNEDPFDGEGAECPEGSKIGAVEVDTPLLEEPLTGELVLGSPKSTDPQSGQMLRLFIVVRRPERGLIAKIAGSSVADPGSGRLTATFDKNPRVPFEHMHVELKGGARGLLATPQACGPKSTGSQFTPWTAAHGGGGPIANLVDDFTVAGDCSFGFAPRLQAGMSTRRAKARGAFSFQFTRRDGEQWLQGLTAQLPKGLLAEVRGVPLCTDVQASTGACPAGSRIGVADAAAGSGDPFVLEQKGEVFLTEGYKGGAYGLMVKVRGIAGPFRGAQELTPIIVRQALHVDRTSARVTAISDPFPLVHHGVPLRIRAVTVVVDRQRFMINPTDCSPQQVRASIVSAQGTTADVATPFQSIACRALPFKPKLSLRLIGRRQTATGGHPGIRALVTQKRGEAGIERAVVRLPLSLALDPDNARALCEYEDGIKPEPACPKGSIVGRARAVSPLLNDPLVGNVYFVKNVRRGASGNLIRTTPMLIVALRGEIAINLRGKTTSRGGKLINVFNNVPDAPISRFHLNIKGGGNGIVTVTKNRSGEDISICGRQVAEVDMNGQNGRHHDTDVRIKTPCRKGKRR